MFKSISVLTFVFGSTIHSDGVLTSEKMSKIAV